MVNSTILWSDPSYAEMLPYKCDIINIGHDPQMAQYWDLYTWLYRSISCHSLYPNNSPSIFIAGSYFPFSR
jgi:hypothetical protein